MAAIINTLSDMFFNGASPIFKESNIKKLNRQSIKAIIFDLDGTLVNAYAAVEQSMNYALSESGFPKVSAYTIKRSVGWGDRQLIEGFVGVKHAPRVLKIYRRHHIDSLKTGVVFLPGAKRVLDIFKQKGYCLAIASNRPEKFTKIILKILGIEHYFDCVLCGDKVKNPKPHPEMLKKILKKFALKTTEALYVGDMTIDVKTGNSARVNTVAVLTGSSTRLEIKALKPFKIIPRIAHLEKIVQQLDRVRKP